MEFGNVIMQEEDGEISATLQQRIHEDGDSKAGRNLQTAGVCLYVGL